MNSEFPEPYDPPESDSIPFATLVTENSDPADGVSVKPSKKWRIYLSWFVIIGLTVFIFSQIGRERKELKKKKVAGKAAMMHVNGGAKMAVGSSELHRQAKIDALTSESVQTEQFNSGSLEQRYGAVLLENELGSPESALEMLESIDERVAEVEYEPTDNQVRLRKIVGALLIQYEEEQWDSSTIDQADRTFLIDQLGWVGELGLTPANSPNSMGRQRLMNEAFNTTIVMLSFSFAGLLTLLAGLGCAVVVSIMISRRTLVGHYSNRSQRAHLYLETFAIWMIAIILLGILSGFVQEEQNYYSLKETWAKTLLSLGVFFGSLIVLIWPVLNGVPISIVFKDIGWTLGNPFKEIGAGIVTYVSMLPFLAISILFVAILSVLTTGVSSQEAGSREAAVSEFAPTGGDGHPIQEDIASGNTATWIGVFLLACVAAPIVEETVFRGIFYRYLRDSTCQRWALYGSVLFACAVNGFIFAVIHPQGIIAIPMLMTLAIGMSLAREWRGSLIAPMTMHAINNTMVTCLMFAIF